MMEIKLTQNQVTIVDDEDFEWLSKNKWYTVDNKHHKYAAMYNAMKGRRVFMHRVIMNVTESKLFVDHKDGNGLNNQRSNLRICSNSQNQMNSKVWVSNKLGVKGVYLYRNKYKTSIVLNGKQIFLGSFDTVEEAAQAYNNAAIKYFSEFAKLNQL